MRSWWRALLLVLVLLLAMAAGLGAWAAAHRGYPDPVYRVAVRYLDWYGDHFVPRYAVEEWIDCDRGTIRAVVTGAGNSHSTQIVSGDTDYILGEAGGFDTYHLSPQDVAAYAQRCRRLRQGGWRAVAATLLAQATGPAARVHLDGRLVLRFQTREHSDYEPQAMRTTVWLDARTGLEQQADTWYADSSLARRIYLRQSRIPPRTLPADFFDLPTTRQGPWDQALGWARDRLAGR